MKQIKNIFIALACVCTLGSCEDFLNVNPKGEVFDQDMFTSAEGYEDALYGIYAELGLLSISTATTWYGFLR